MVNKLPFEAFPHRLIVEMVYNVTFQLNAFPHNDGMHKVMSPHTILTGLHINHNKHCTLEFGLYVHVHEEQDNSMTSHTSGAIALRPTGNTQGTHYFLNINSSRRVARNHWTALPMPNEVIQAIHRLAAANKKHKVIVFKDKSGNILNDNSPKEPNNTEITGVSTGVGNTGNSETESNNNTEAINNNNNRTETTERTNSTHEDEEINTQEHRIPEIQETHSTHEDEEETYEEPMAHVEHIIEEMNVTNMQHNSETEIKESHIETTDKYTESQQDIQAGNTHKPRV